MMHLLLGALAAAGLIMACAAGAQQLGKPFSKKLFEINCHFDLPNPYCVLQTASNNITLVPPARFQVSLDETGTALGIRGLEIGAAIVLSSKPAVKKSNAKDQTAEFVAELQKLYSDITIVDRPEVFVFSEPAAAIEFECFLKEIPIRGRYLRVKLNGEIMDICFTSVQSAYDQALLFFNQFALGLKASALGNPVQKPKMEFE